MNSTFSFSDYCRDNDINNVKRLLHNSNIIFDHEINFGFHIACYAGHTNIVKTILECDYFLGINVKDEIYNSTALHDAIGRGNIEIVRLILNDVRFTSLNIKGRHGNTAFIIACYSNLIDILKLIINHPSFNSLNDKNNEGWSGFDLACRYGNIKIVKLLLKNKKLLVDVNKRLSSDNEIQTLIEEYIENPDYIRCKLIFEDEVIDVYRSCILISDNYYYLK